MGGSVDVSSPLLTAQEAADYLRRSVHTIARWRREGIGPRFIGGGRGCPVCYRRVELDAWIASQVRRSTAAPGNPDG